MYFCEICNKEFDSKKQLHFHVSKTEKMQLPLYYHTYHPRYDKYTNKLIKFKDYNQYFSNDFNSRSNFLKWFVNNIKNKETKKYCYESLELRISRKNLKFAPSQSELSTISIPNINGFEAISCIREYLEFCENKNIKLRYEYKKYKPKSLNQINSIIIDTREQKPLDFPGLKIINKKLDFGDYSSPDCNFSIERKSLDDFVGTMSSGFERFKKEIERSTYLVVLVEASLKEVIDFKPPYNRKFQKAKGSFVCNRMRSLSENYENVQFLFAKDREESAELCKKILSMSENIVRKTDLQWKYDNHLLL